MEYFVDSEDCRLHVTRTGSGPVLLLIHGVACDSSFFQKTSEYLSGRYTVISYDRRGYSLSAAGADASYSAKVQAADALRILDQAGCRRACVAACSAGGIVALELARRYPERVEKLFLHETPLAADPQIQGAFDAYLERLRAAAARYNTARAMLILLQAVGGADPAAEPVSFEQQGRNMKNYELFLYHEMEEFLSYGRAHPGMRPEMPCVLASGEDDREGLFSKYAPAAAESLGCRYMRTPGCHNLAWDRPREFARCLMEALEPAEP